MLNKIKSLYIKILAILISLIFFSGKTNACDFPAGVEGKCINIVKNEKSNYEIVIEFILNNINYILGLIFLMLTTVIYFLNKKNKYVGKNKD